MKKIKSNSLTDKLSSIVVILLYCISYFIYIQFLDLTYMNALIDSICLAVLLIPTALLIQHIQSFFHASSPLNIANISFVVLFSFIITLLNHTVSIQLIHSDFKQADILLYAIFPKGISVLFILFIILTYHWSKKQRLELVNSNERAIEKERESLKIELNSLQQQFKPHFLFNSLNSINALTITSPEEARRMIHLLSEFMRGSIRENKNDFVSLKEEVKHLKLYTDIEKVRFGKRLNINYTIPEEALTLKLPHLILQPLIENAIKYGLYGQVDNITISIHATHEKNNLIITMENPYDSMFSMATKGTGYGLLSIEKKMQLLFSQLNLLSISKTETTFKVQLKIPQA